MIMFEFLKIKPIKLKQVKVLVDQTNTECRRLEQLSNDELREHARQLQRRILSEMAPYEEAIASVKQKLEQKGTLDVLDMTELYDQLERKEQDKYDHSETVLKSYIPQAFALVKNTCARFTASAEVRVSANEFDQYLDAYREYVTIEGGTAIYSNHWMAGGKDLYWNMIPNDSQLMTGIVLQFGGIAEMLNGEGKTLASLFPLFLNGLGKRKVFMCTDNPFLSDRDCRWMRPILEFHGIRVSEIDHTFPNSDGRRTNYRADIVYGTANEFCFDYLRDQLVDSLGAIVQPRPDVLLIDEVDAILIDAATDPLVISGSTEREQLILAQFGIMKDVIKRLVDDQLCLLDGYFAEAKELLAKEEYKSAARLLHLIRRSNPSYPLHYFLNTTPGAIKHLNKFERTAQADEPLAKLEKELF